MSTDVRYSCPPTFYETFERKGGQQWTTHYCPGCGHGNVHKFVAEAIDDFGIQDRTVLVNPVGCAVFAYYYLDVGNVQVAHGRCPAVATALKRAHPDSIVLGYQGDGDLAAIGGNEILHAANRGENVTIFFVNNAIYGMTGGQMAPTTLIGMQTSTTPAGRSATEGFPVKVSELLSSLDAPYYIERVALGDPKHNHKTRLAVRKAIRNQMEHRGFSLVEILSPCPTGWKQTPTDSSEWVLNEMTKTFPLGVFRDGHELDLGHPRRRTEVALDAVPGLLDLEETNGESMKLPDHGTQIDEVRAKISGFGGQGVLLIGTLLAHAGMLARRQVSWMPSYGPEMRGGTAHCCVTLSDDEIGSPLIEQPSHLVAMNGPSLERFGKDVLPSGTILYNSSMIDEVPERDDVTYLPVPANEIADRLGNPRVANMVVLGAMLRHGCGVSKEAVLAALPSALKSTPQLLEIDRKAIEAGMEAA